MSFRPAQGGMSRSRECEVANGRMRRYFVRMSKRIRLYIYEISIKIRKTLKMPSFSLMRVQTMSMILTYYLVKLRYIFVITLGRFNLMG